MEEQAGLNKGRKEGREEGKSSKNLFSHSKKARKKEKQFPKLQNELEDTEENIASSDRKSFIFV